MDWKSLLDQSDSVSPSLSMGITCRDLCWLMYRGSSLVKLVAAYCIQELLAKIGDHRNKEGDLNCSIECLRSLVAVLEGHVFDSDVGVAINCGMCFVNHLELGSIRHVWEKNPLCRQIVQDDCRRIGDVLGDSMFIVKIVRDAPQACCSCCCSCPGLE
ncbi:hypothetical protein Droror1_Dr00025859 [Drosera rotundifolia]